MARARAQSAQFIVPTCPHGSSQRSTSGDRLRSDRWRPTDRRYHSAVAMRTGEQRRDLRSLEGRKVEYTGYAQKLHRRQLLGSARQAHGEEWHFRHSRFHRPLVEQRGRDEIAVADHDVRFVLFREAECLRCAHRRRAVGTEAAKVAAQVLAEIGVAPHAKQTHPGIYRVPPRKFRAHVRSFCESQRDVTAITERSSAHAVHGRATVCASRAIVKRADQPAACATSLGSACFGARVIGPSDVAGRLKRNVLPFPTSEVTSSSPWSISASRREMGSPRPVPSVSCDFPSWTNSSKIFS